MNEEALFEAALKLPAAERDALLKRECAGNAALRERVDALLAVADRTGGWVESTKEHNPAGESPDAVIAGRYTLIERIGEGGMGEVWVAKQSEPVKRKVALKLIKAGMDSKAVMQRFEQERQALALMDHPNIAKVFDGGMTAERRPFFAMELVNGLPLTKFCDDAKLDIRQRLELFVAICQAVQHAHQKGIIHRDLKPSNILVSILDGRPVPKVIDFGVAKAISGQLTEESLSTQFGAVVGTLEYMSPEQAGFSATDIDTRADIYSLGVILYELLTGLRPIDAARLRKEALTEMIRIIREEEPSKPSTRLSTDASAPSLAALRHTEPRKLAALLRGELDWVVMKCLEKQRDRRYETANGLARDIQRYLADEAVEARPPSAGYRLRKFVKRNKGQVIAASVMILSLVGGAGIAIWQAARAESARANEATQKLVAVEEKRKAEQAEVETLASYRASMDDAIEQLIGSKSVLGPKERTYLENALKRWQAFADRKGDDERSQSSRAEGHYRVGRIWHKLGRREEAYREYETARDLQRSLTNTYPAVPTYRQDLARSHNYLGVLHDDLGKREEAQREYKTARDLQKRLTDAFPDVPEYQHELAGTHDNLGVLHDELGHWDEARREYEAARDLQKKLSDTFPAVPVYRKDLATTRNYLGALLAGLDRPEEARREYEAARDLHQKLSDTFPTVPEYQQHLARTLNNLGVFLADLGRRDEARREYENARDIQKKLSDSFPAVPEYRQELARTHNNLGNVLTGLKRWEEARREYGLARDLRKKLADDFPAIPEYQRALARTHNTMGNLFADQGRREEARREYETACDLQKKMADAFPAVPAYKIELGGTYGNLGSLICENGQPEESLHWYDLAIRTLKPLHEAEPREMMARQFLRNSHSGRAETYDQLNRHADAVKDWDRAIELSPTAEQSNYRASRATSRLQAGQIAEAVAEVAELTKVETWNAGRWYDFACVYAVASDKLARKKLEFADRAMELLQKAVNAGYKNIAHMKKDTDLKTLGDREDFKKLLAELEAKAAKP